MKARTFLVELAFERHKLLVAERKSTMENNERSFKERFWDFANEHPIITFLVVLAALDAIVAILR